MNIADVAALLEMVLAYPKQCAAEGIEAVARYRAEPDSVVDLADLLAAWKRRQRENKEAA